MLMYKDVSPTTSQL